MQWKMLFGARATAVALGIAMFVAPIIQGSAAAAEPPKEWDGLERIPNKRMDLVYVRPQATLAAYKRVKLDPVRVSFDKDWDPNRGERSPSRMLSKSDIEEIKTDLATEFRKVFVEELSKGGYAVVEQNDDDVLGVTAIIMDLYITAPERPGSGRSHTYINDAGHMTLAIELRDSVTDQLLARAVDKAQGAYVGRMQVSNGVTNSAEARRAIVQWADVLRDALDEVHGKPGQK